jgi:hypothetical protein
MKNAAIHEVHQVHEGKEGFLPTWWKNSRKGAKTQRVIATNSYSQPTGIPLCVFAPLREIPVSATLAESRKEEEHAQTALGAHSRSSFLLPKLYFLPGPPFFSLLVFLGVLRG